VPIDQADEHEAGQPIRCSPALFRATYETFRRSPALHEEIFGPAAIAVICESEQELAEAAAAIHGSLTGTIWASASDEDLARRLGTVLESRVGRLIYNGVPTGVEVCPAMVHGGPFPATNQPHTTAVGPFAIQRWCRPVCYQSPTPSCRRNCNRRTPWGSSGW
jgi:NADP-dependent aldehyde dehydrogenase